MSNDRCFSEVTEASTSHTHHVLWACEVKVDKKQRATHKRPKIGICVALLFVDKIAPLNENIGSPKNKTKQSKKPQKDQVTVDVFVERVHSLRFLCQSLPCLFYVPVSP